MIDSITGVVVRSGDGYVVLKTAGIGVKIFCTHNAARRLARKKSATLHCVLYPDNVELYGFEKEAERTLFTRLLSVPGVGPKNALRIMNSCNARELDAAVASGRAERVARTCGVGTKTAARLILEMRGKIHSDSASDVSENRFEAEVASALKRLGYSKKEITTALSQLPKKPKSLQQTITIALKNLAPPHLMTR
jgi:Holliday junction DNA helicase RuvA